jgi:hypothetical protein
MAPPLRAVHNMSMFICASCGTQYADSPVPPARCDVCRNETSLESSGRAPWTTLEQIRVQHTNVVQRLEPDLFSVRSIPTFLAGQRALLLRTPHGNILWDCITAIDEGAVRPIRALRGVAAIAMSHPRHFASVIEWSHAFGGVPVYVHATSRRWLMRPDAAVHYWDGAALTLLESAMLIHIGGGVAHRSFCALLASGQAREAATWSAVLSLAIPKYASPS